MGLEVANYYQEEGYKSLNGFTKKDIDNLIVDLKVQGREHEIQRSISALKNTKRLMFQNSWRMKGMDDIVKNIGDTVNIIDIIKPIYNFKAGGD